MKLWNRYLTPKTIDEALAMLHQHAGNARIIAGGTDLLVDLRAEESEPQNALVDITRIPELAGIHDEGDHVLIGAGVTHAQIVKSPLIAMHATCLVESCGVVGGPQVRNVATLGGNVAHALPAGDGTVSLVALSADAEVIHNGERRWLPIQALYMGPGKSLLDSTRDLLIRFRIRKRSGQEATAFKRIMRPQGVALPILGCAVAVRLNDARDTFDAVQVCISPLGPTPQRPAEIEAMLNGKPASTDTIEMAAAYAQSVLHPRTSKYRATADYRLEMASVLLRRTLTLAVSRAQTGQVTPEGVGV